MSFLSPWDEDWLYFADQHYSGGEEGCPGSGRNVRFAWDAKTGDLSDSGMTPAPRLLRVGPCSHCGMVVEVRVRS